MVPRWYPDGPQMVPRPSQKLTFLKNAKIDRIRSRDHVESIDLDERIFVPPNESSVAALGASLVTKQ